MTRPIPAWCWGLALVALVTTILTECHPRARVAVDPGGVTERTRAGAAAEAEIIRPGDLQH